MSSTQPTAAAPALPLPYRSSCPDGEIQLHLIDGNPQDPYAVCFSTFTVSVTYSGSSKTCTLRVKPDPLADNLRYGNASSVNGAEVSCRAGSNCLQQPAAVGLRPAPLLSESSRSWRCGAPVQHAWKVECRQLSACAGARFL